MRCLWDFSEIQEVLNLPKASYPSVTGVTFDSRAVKAGDLFIAFKGPHKDGYDFVDQALDQGAAYCLVEKPHKDSRTLVVDNALESLKELAYQARKRTQAKVIGITGSFGKTTAKECIAYLLRTLGPTTATEKSYNNHWGVPLSVANLFKDDAFGVFEVGTNHPGEIEALVKYIKPHVGLITTVGDAHQGNFDSLEAIVHEKCQLFQGMQTGDIAVLPCDHSHFELMKQEAQKRQLAMVTFGRHPQAQVRLETVTPNPQGLTVTFYVKDQPFTYHLNAYGEHLVETTLGVMATLYALNIDLSKVVEAMASFHLLPGRGQIRQLPLKGQADSFITLVDESYNAGPASMKESLKAFNKLPLPPKGRRWVVLGDMLELGPMTAQAHKDLKQSLESMTLQGAFLFGSAMEHLSEVLPASLHYGHYKDLKTLSQTLETHLQPGDAVFIKGSRGQRDFRGRMAAVIDYLESPSRETF